MGLNSYVVRSGEYRHRIQFQTLTNTQDGTTGAITRVWTNSFMAWANIEPLNGRELLAAAAVQSTVSHSISVRWRTEFAVDAAADVMRIIYKTRVFNINTIMNEDERNRSVTLLVEEGLTNG
jgi:SPP1 family predicted phage head-tail adaptor